MVELGKSLQMERIQSGLSLEEVSSRTRISVRVLKEMESGDFSNIQGHFYIHHFIREFVRAVSPEPEKFLITHSEQIRQSQGKREIPPSQTLQKLQYYRFRKRKRLGIILFLIILLVTAYFLFGVQLKTLRNWINRVPSPASAGAVFEPDWLNSPLNSPASSQTIACGLEQQGFISSRSSSPVIFKARFEERCWARVQRSGRTEVSRVFQAGDLLETRGYDLRITLGNPSVVRFSINNRPETRYEDQSQPITFHPEPTPPYKVNPNEPDSIPKSSG